MENITLVEDTRQQVSKHELKHTVWSELGIKVIRSKLPLGDYADIKNMSVVVDTKKDIQEVIGNITKQHVRFRNECLLAQDSDIKLIILIENYDSVKSIEDLNSWTNPRVSSSSKATSGHQLAKILKTMETKYGVEFKFCSPEESGTEVLRLLNLL